MRNPRRGSCRTLKEFLEESLEQFLEESLEEFMEDFVDNFLRRNPQREPLEESSQGINPWREREESKRKFQNCPGNPLKELLNEPPQGNLLKTAAGDSRSNF